MVGKQRIAVGYCAVDGRLQDEYAKTLRKAFSPVEVFNWSLRRTIALNVRVHKRNTAHITPMLKGTENSEHTFVDHEFLSLSLYAVEGLQAKFGGTHSHMQVRL